MLISLVALVLVPRTVYLIIYKSVKFLQTCNYIFFFFFSSRRRHTRCSRDWSSDVCSSDLSVGLAVAGSPWGADYFPNVPLITQDGTTVHFYEDLLKGKKVAINLIYTSCKEIGRASCRERV